MIELVQEKLEESPKKKKIYFAHPYDKWKSKREEMIERLLEQRGYEVVNPFKKENKLNEKYGVENYYENPTRPFAKDIVNKDWYMVADCDSYFGWFPKDVTMIGTPIELTWALLLQKEIISLCYKPQPFLWLMSNKLYIDYDNFVNDTPFVNQETTWNLLEMVSEQFVNEAMGDGKVSGIDA